MSLQEPIPDWTDRVVTFLSSITIRSIEYGGVVVVGDDLPKDLGFDDAPSDLDHFLGHDDEGNEVVAYAPSHWNGAGHVELFYQPEYVPDETVVIEESEWVSVIGLDTFDPNSEHSSRVDT